MTAQIPCWTARCPSTQQPEGLSQKPDLSAHHSAAENLGAAPWAGRTRCELLRLTFGAPTLIDPSALFPAASPTCTARAPAFWSPRFCSRWRLGQTCFPPTSPTSKFSVRKSNNALSTKLSKDQLGPCRRSDFSLLRTPSALGSLVPCAAV